MIGHQPIIAMRRAGYAPSHVVITTDPNQQRFAGDWHRWAGSTPEVAITADDPLHRLDLRFLVGIQLCDVSGSDPERVQAVFDACVKAGAKRVIAAVVWSDGNRSALLKTIDSKGQFTWQA